MVRSRGGADGKPTGVDLGEVLFEWRTVGDAVRLAAIDPSSGIEVVVFGPAGAGAAALRSLAKRKLYRRVVERCGRPR